ncbi:hypothetical protein Scep_017893 [Stephania cephalantha]|uniref:Spermidine synthase n=1 Tax=Stephania cephalantha TaxID=152367 RepID=A0AAP0NW25_9MAGN
MTSSSLSLSFPRQIRPLYFPPFQISRPFPSTRHKPLTAKPKDDGGGGGDDGIPSDLVKTLAKFHSEHNYIRVLQVSRRADHPFAGSRLLLLDKPGNIHSISNPFRHPNDLLTDTYFDVFATLPPLLPPGPIAILGFGAGTAARLILSLYPESEVHGWEIDPAVIAVAREYFGLAELEREHGARVRVRVGDAFGASVGGGFAGAVVDLFERGSLVKGVGEVEVGGGEEGVEGGGRVMVNVGGRCVEAESGVGGGVVGMEEALMAMSVGFGGEVSVLSLGDDDCTVALTGELPHLGKWKEMLPCHELRAYADMWRPYDPRGLAQR